MREDSSSRPFGALLRSGDFVFIDLFIVSHDLLRPVSGFLLRFGRMATPRPRRLMTGYPLKTFQQVDESF